MWDNLVKLIAGTDLADADLESIIKKAAADPAKVGIFNNAAQVLEPLLLLEMPEGGWRRGADGRRCRKDRR